MQTIPNQKSSLFRIVLNWKNINKSYIKFPELSILWSGKNPYHKIYLHKWEQKLWLGKNLWRLGKHNTIQKNKRIKFNIEWMIRNLATVVRSFTPVEQPVHQKLLWSATIIILGLPMQRLKDLILTLPKKKVQEECFPSCHWVTSPLNLLTL